MRVTVASVVFLEALEYFIEFLDSLKVQNSQNFEILLINDNIPQCLLQEKLKCFDVSFLERISIVDKRVEQLAPFELRVELLKEALARKINLLILLDCDDKAKNNRVSEIIQQYDENYAFFYNDICSFDDNKIMPDIPQITDKIDYILECNYLGLSNCAINMKQISKEFIESLKEGRTLIFDWYLFSRILLSNKKGKKINNTCTYYRIYENNIAGIPSHVKDKLEKEKRIKLIHYQLLKEYDERFLKLTQKYENIDITLQQNDSDGKLQFWWNMLTDL